MRHPWVAKADDGIRFGLQINASRDPTNLSRLLEIGRWAETVGFDGFFVPDHPLSIPDPFIVMSGLAPVTQTIMLGSVVHCAFYRHPFMVARMASDLDHLSGGRFMLGLGIGWDKAEFAAVDMTFERTPKLQHGLEEAVRIIDGAWQSEPFSINGAVFSTTDAHVSPSIQQPRIPIMIAGGGEKTTLRQVARFADACNFDELERGGVDVVRHKLDVLRRHCDDVNRPYEEILRTYFINKIFLAPSEVEARAKADADLPPERRAALEIEMQTAMPRAEPGIMDRSIVVGTPEMAIEYCRQRVDAGIQYIIFMSPIDIDPETLELLVTEVIPNSS